MVIQFTWFMNLVSPFFSFKNKKKNTKNISNIVLLDYSFTVFFKKLFSEFIVYLMSFVMNYNKYTYNI